MNDARLRWVQAGEFGRNITEVDLTVDPFIGLIEPDHLAFRNCLNCGGFLPHRGWVFVEDEGNGFDDGGWWWVTKCTRCGEKEWEWGI